MDTVERLKKEFDEDVFKRDLYIRLSSEKGTPTDILDIEIGKVDLIEREFLVVEAVVDVDFSCSVGYDRQEVYYEKGEKKTKTVTDWLPYSGKNHSEEHVVVENKAESDYLTVQAAIQASKEAKDESVEACKAEEMQETAEALDFAKSECIANSFYGVKLPGDHQKDKSYSGTAEVQKVSGVFMPEYEVEYTYKENKYTAKAFACGLPYSRYEAPNESADISSIVKKKATPLKWAAIGLLILGVILNVVAYDLGLYLIGYLGAIAAVIVYFVVRYKMEKKIFGNRQEEKKVRLEKLLQEKGYEKLTAEELAVFDKK